MKREQAGDEDGEVPHCLVWALVGYKLLDVCWTSRFLCGKILISQNKTHSNIDFVLCVCFKLEIRFCLFVFALVIKIAFYPGKFLRTTSFKINIEFLHNSF